MNKPARGRPRSFDAQQVLGIVADCFRDGGYSATSLDEIAAATGLNRPSLYAAYGDKKAMYLAALARQHDAIAQSFDRLDAEALGLRDTIAALFAWSIASYLAGPHGARGCLAVGTASAEAVRDADIRAALDRTLALVDTRIARWFVRDGIADGAGRAQLVGAAIHSLGVRVRAGQPRETLEAIAAQAIEAIVPR
ncbi:TetR/AcrR family transcriptional regulator [Sphingomonas cavernae]|uniref:TetR/AcrR family transcriptional regulator n=1 Tax=Sphingomonas cavernae TaxID=2320861 RepID=A0A418WQB4_9SPHN|nr:TetR/AcrR family transcriptional regulator [Sphingomonas cavernae]RJF93349.1 TetR/AcrR family transcriptional regulator [Sphingomonas cavernae]